MKKLTALLLAAVLMLSLAACTQAPADGTTCSGSDTGPSTAPSVPATQPTETKPVDPNGLYGKASYTVTDDAALAARDTVIATMGDQKLTNGLLQTYYWSEVYDFLNNYGYYAVSMGLDYTKPLDTQNCPDNDGTWQHFFLESALNTWHTYQAMALMARDTNLQPSEDLKTELSNLHDNLAELAKSAGYDSVDAMLSKDMGVCCTFEDYYTYTEVYYTGYEYFSSCANSYTVTDDMIEAYFTQHESELKKNGVTKESGSVADVRHILIEVEGKTDADWETCRQTAQNLLDSWKANDPTEESFALLAQKHSADDGSSANGGLYTDLNKDTNFVEEFKTWYLDETRQAGDTGLVKTTYGYHIMYYSGSEAQWIRQCRSGVLNEYTTKLLEEALAAYPITTNFPAIVLTEVDLGGE